MTGDVMIVAQLPVQTPSVDWVGLLPVLFPAAGALLWLLVRSLLPSRLTFATLDAVWTFVSAVAGVIAVVVLWQRDSATDAFEGQ